MSSEHLKQDIEHICKVNGIKIVYQKSNKERAFTRSRIIHIREAKGNWTYLSAMHEIGHVIGLFQGKKQKRMKQEVEAWRWAIENSIVPITAKSRELIGNCLKGYIEYYLHLRERGGTVWLPDEESELYNELWTLINGNWKRNQDGKIFPINGGKKYGSHSWNKGLQG